MNRLFFLQGPIGAGKSTLLQDILRPIAHLTAGFTTQRIFQNGKLIGFRAALLKNALPPLKIESKIESKIEFSDGLDNIFMLNKQLDIKVLEKAILRVEEEIKNPNIKLILLDEIGGIELVSDVFMGALRRVFKAGKPCAGVLKSADNLANTLTSHNLGPEYKNLHSELVSLIKDGGTLFDINGENLNEATESLKIFIDKIHTFR